MDDWEAVQQALRGLKYGNVNVIVQDGVIVLIERTEKRKVRVRPAAGCAGHPGGSERRSKDDEV